MKRKTKRILVVVVKWRHRANGPLLTARCPDWPEVILCWIAFCACTKFYLSGKMWTQPKCKWVNEWMIMLSRPKQFGSMPVFEEAKTMVYVTNHNMITIAMVIFKTFKMADKGEERVLTNILVYSCFIESFIWLRATVNWEVPWGHGVTILTL